MYVCICNGITDKQIRAAVAEGVTSLRQLEDKLGVASQCGSCAEHALSLIAPFGETSPVNPDLFYSAS